jgi:hypothetical protein
MENIGKSAGSEDDNLVQIFKRIKKQNFSIMKLSRKNFLKLSGLAGVGMMFGTGKAGAKSNTAISWPHTQTFNMHGYAAPKLNTVRIGFIGIGGRGSGNVSRYASIEGVEVKALCDPVASRVGSSLSFLKRSFPAINPIPTPMDPMTGGGFATVLILIWL